MGCIAGSCSAARRRCRPRPDVICPRCSNLFTCNSILPVSPSRRRGCPTPSCTPASAHSSRRCKPGDALPTQPPGEVRAPERSGRNDPSRPCRHPGQYSPALRAVRLSAYAALLLQHRQCLGRATICPGRQAAHHHRRAVGQGRSSRWLHHRGQTDHHPQHRLHLSTACARSVCRPGRCACCPTNSSTAWVAAAEILGDVGGSSPDHWDRIWDYRPGGTGAERCTCGSRSASAPILTARRCRSWPSGRSGWKAW